MLDILSKAGFSSEIQASLSSTCLSSSVMADYRSYEENKRARTGVADEEANGGLYRMCTSDVEDDDGLDLSLGLPLGGSSSRVKKSTQVLKVSPGSFSLCSTESPESFRRDISEGGQAVIEKSLSVDVHALQKMSHGMVDQKTCGDSLVQTRDQVWEALQKRNFVSSHDAVNVEGAAALQELKQATALWGRRSNSMQALVVPKDSSDGARHPIRRLSSNDATVNMKILPHLYDSAASPLSRQVSSVESLLEKGSETPTACPQRQEALERQRKMEQQTLRRQEARRRRKCLIVEKQHKKARKEDRSLPFEPSLSVPTSSQKISSACTDPQKASFTLCQGSDSGDRLMYKESLETTPDRPGFPRISCSGVDNILAGRNDRVAESRLKPLDLDVNIDPNTSGRVRGAVAVECEGKEVSPRDDSCVDIPIHYAGGLEQGSILKGKKRLVRPRASGVGAPPSVGQMGNSSIRLNDVDGKICHSSTSESESGDVNEELSAVRNECGEVDVLSSKYAGADGSQSVGSGVSFTSVNSLAYPSPFPVLPIPYPIPVPGAPPAAIPVQLGFSLPCFMQFPAGGGGESSMCTSSQPSSYSAHGSGTLPPYRFPVPDGSYPWFSVVPTGGATAQPAPCQSPKDSSVTKSPSTECKNELCSGKRLEDAKKSVVSDSPLASSQKTASKNFSKDQARTLLPPSSKQGVCQAPAHVSQRKAGGLSSVQHDRKKDTASANLNFPVERQQSWPNAAEIATHDTGSVEQTSLRLRSEEHQSHFPGGEPSGDYEMGPSPNKLRRCGSTTLSVGLKQEELSAESQLASENSGQEVSIEQSVSADGQKGTSIPELPWVTTTGVGPNGKSISGVMYISSSRQIRLVCSCHGKHMSPTEFVEHSGSIDLSNPERNILVNPFPFQGQLASTPV